MKRYDIHIHYLFKINIDETVNIFKEEFEKTNTYKYNFLSIPIEYTDKGMKKEDKLQNIKGLFLKKSFSPNAYAFAGLEHMDNESDLKKVSEHFVNQAKKYMNAGYDGFKMIEGYPTFIKYSKLDIDSIAYDKFYEYCEKNDVPILLHMANPDENWDIKHASKEAIAQGRVYDETYPSKETITNQMFNILNKHPNLRLIIAHFGFFSNHIEDAEKFLGEYKNTIIDITPGGEQLINMSKNWEIWHEYFKKYQERIVYGTDFYAFPKDENYEVCYRRRPDFVSNFFEDSNEHIYLDVKFKGINLEKELIEKIYYKNFEKIMGIPKDINKEYAIKELERLEKETVSSFDLYDIKYMKNGFKNE